jgi:hypothetical protein
MSWLSDTVFNMAGAVESGGLMMMGSMPEIGINNRGFFNEPGKVVRNFGPHLVETTKRNGPMPEGLRFLGDDEIAHRGLTKPGVAGWLGMGLMGGMSGYFMYQGYQENGIKGAFDAGVIDLATNTAVASLAYKPGASQIGPMQAGVQRQIANRAVTGWFGSHMVTGGMIGIGGFAGASIGQSIAGPIGAFAGAFAGGAFMRNPMVAVPTMAAMAGAYTIGKGAYHILKTGYRKGQSRHTIGTAGDTASFFTRNAHTMRARAVQAMHKSHLNARSALGQEANFMHMPNKNYFSTYRRMGNMV